MVVAVVAVSLLSVDPQAFTGENVRNRWQGVVGLGCWDVVDVRGVGEVRGLVGNMSCHWMGLMPASKALVKGCGLDDSLVGKLLVRRRYD